MTDSTIKRVLVTGVSGQDGSYMADYLLANTPHLIFGMVRRTAKPDYSNLTGALANPRFKLVTGDLTDAHSIDSLVAEIKPDYFINLGAQSFVGSSWKLPELTQQTNANGVQHCLEAVRKHVPHCRFYAAGTSEEFGAVEYSPQDEKHPARPQSPYGASKVAARQHVRVYRESYGLYAVQGWLFNHESPRRGEEFLTRKVTKGVARIAAAIKAGTPFEPIELGNLHAKRDWSHAEDFVEGIWRMMNQEPPPENVAEISIGGKPVERLTPLVLGWDPQEYVLASGEIHTVREFVEKAFAAADIGGQWAGSGIGETYVTHACWDEGQKRPVGHGVVSTLVRINPAFYRPAEVNLLWGDASRARTELGWQPRHSFDDLVAEMVRADLKDAGL